MRKALVVGIDNYKNDARLSGCINDATEFAKLIKRNGDGSKNFDVKLVKDVRTKSKLLGLIKETFKGGKDATSLFYFAGHGFINDLGGYIVTPDAKQHDEGVSMDDILKIAIKSGVSNRIIILDCCHSGIMGTPGTSETASAQLVNGMTILTSSLESEFAMEVNGHGVFTNLLLDALRGGAADILGNITPGSIYA